MGGAQEFSNVPILQTLGRGMGGYLDYTRDTRDLAGLEVTFQLGIMYMSFSERNFFSLLRIYGLSTMHGHGYLQIFVG